MKTKQQQQQDSKHELYNELVTSQKCDNSPKRSYDT